MRLIEVSEEDQNLLRKHGYMARELVYEKGTPPPEGSAVIGYLRGSGESADLEVTSVRPSQRSLHTHIILFQLKSTLPDR